MPLHFRPHATSGLVTFLAVLAAASPATAQHLARDAAVRAGAETITEQDVRRRIGIIADDSMGGRDTPSRGLDLTASYIAGEFSRMGLFPLFEAGKYIQRYPAGYTRLDADRTRATFVAGEVVATALAQRDLVFIFGPRTGSQVSAPVVLVGGALQLDSASTLSVEGKILLIVANGRAPNSTPFNQFLGGAFERGPAAVVMVTNNDTATFARQVANQFRDRGAVPGELDTDPVVVMVHERVVTQALGAAGVDVEAMRRSSTYTVRSLPTLAVGVTVTDVDRHATTAPNVAGLIEGSDPVLRHEIVLFSAHMDHVGTNGEAVGDTIWNGADDDASGTAAVLELAEAFSTTGARPKRSLLFLAVSGEEKGLVGSEYFATNSPVPLGQIVADLNMDMIGRNWRDRIAVIGRADSDLGATLDRVTLEHPELEMRPINDQWPREKFYSRSDHYNFARRGIPILFFFNGNHKDYHQASDSPDKIDAEKEARIVQLVYYLGQEVGNAPQRPEWKPESFRKIVEGASRR